MRNGGRVDSIACKWKLAQVLDHLEGIKYGGTQRFDLSGNPPIWKKRDDAVMQSRSDPRTRSGSVPIIYQSINLDSRASEGTVPG
jgi:hypothetical protein